MARSFTATTHNLRNNSVPAVASAGSIFIRIKPNWNHNDGAQHFIWHRGVTNLRDYPSFQKFTDNSVYIGFYTGTEQRLIVAATAAMFTNGTWANHLFTWSDAANTETYYVDNSQVGIRTAALTPTLEAGITIGNYASSGGQLNCNAELAEYGEWDRILDAAERAILQVSGCPLSVPRGLVNYYPILGRHSPEIGPRNGLDLTVTNTAQANHPRIFLPAPPVKIAAPVAGGITHQGEASLSIATTVSPDARATYSAEASHQVAVSATPTGRLTLPAAAALSVGVSLSADATVIRAAEASHQVAVNATPTARATYAAESALPIAVDVSPSARATYAASSALPVVVSLTASGSIQGAPITGEAALSVAVGVTSTARVTYAAVAALPVSVALSATATRVLMAAVALQAAVTLSGTATAYRLAAAALSVAVSVSAPSRVTLNAAASHNVTVGMDADLVARYSAATALQVALLLLAEAVSGPAGTPNEPVIRRAHYTAAWIRQALWRPVVTRRADYDDVEGG